MELRLAHKGASAAPKLVTRRIRVYGIVQGVGFRPTVARHAGAARVSGTVCNYGPYVEIYAQGNESQVSAFVRLLQEQPPRRASIIRLDVEDAPGVCVFNGFSIIESGKTAGDIFVSPDIAICDECAAELYDPSNRRYLHPFINCTNCGPRLTILDSMPYDRVRTSMGTFPMCPACEAEYRSPSSRRYDAQPVCCNDCGPEVYVLGGSERGGAAITAARRTIAAGGIVAVKGIGGFHLCCDATNEAAVAELRRRKRRPAKPFAVMMRDLTTVERECVIACEGQRDVLCGHQKPIVLLGRRPAGLLAESVAPGNPKVGVMLPYAPLQLLLFDYNDDIEMPRCLVMTSGNVSGAPICRDDADAARELEGIADLTLSHNRLIRIRSDDSVMDWWRGRPYMIRRSRGYAPLPVPVSGLEAGQVLAVGGELKNAFCIARGGLLYLSPYVGDLGDVRTMDALAETVGRFRELLEAEPEAVVCDLHPGYNSSAYARTLGLPVVEVQHHYAHVLSCMAENNHLAPVLGIALDGTGYGSDGSIWGGELLVTSPEGFERVGSIAPFAQVGGDAAAREGWRVATGMLGALASSREEAAAWAARLGLCGEAAAKVQLAMAASGVNTVTSTSAGRLFDAVSAILGICRSSSFEGEAAMALQFAAERALSRETGAKAQVPCAGAAVGSLDGAAETMAALTGDIAASVPAHLREFDDRVILPTDELVRGLVERRLAGEDVEALALRFHRGLATQLVAAATRICAERGLDTVALSGGSFQNTLLLELVAGGLEREGLQVLTHSLVPANDGGIALGQAVAALARHPERRPPQAAGVEGSRGVHGDSSTTHPLGAPLRMTEVISNKTQLDRGGN